MKVLDSIKISFYLVKHLINGHRNSNMQMLRSFVNKVCGVFFVWVFFSQTVS